MRGYLQRALKYKAMYGVLSEIEAYLFLKSAWLPPIFFLDTKSTYYDLLSPDSFKPRKNIPVLVKETRVSRDARNVCTIKQ